MKKLLAMILACTMLLALSACGGKENTDPDDSGVVSGDDAGAYADLDPVELILADSAAKGAAGSTFDQLVADNVAEITGGKLTIATYLNGELGNDTDILRQMQGGDIDIVGCQVAPIVSFIPEMAIFDLPMVFATSDGDKIDAVLNGDSETHAALAAAYENVGWHLLGFLQNATYRLTTANVALTDLQAFSHLQIRTMENVNHMAFWTAIGAEPTPLAWAEVYFALQSGAINAHENAADTIVGANINEVQDYLACTNHILYLNQICINKDSYDALDPAYQAALDEAVALSIEQMRPTLSDIDRDNKQILADSGMTIIEYEDSFFEEILALPAVQELYNQIDEATNGLAVIMQSELAA